MTDVGRTPTPSGAPAVPAQVILRPTASPLPIGLLALAVGSFVLSGRQLGWAGTAQSHAVALCLLAFVVPLQLISFVFAVLGRDEGTASGLAVLAGSWAATGLVTVLSKPGARSAGLGLLLLAAAVALVVPAAVTAGSKPLVTAVMLLAAIRFGLTGVYHLQGAAAWRSAAGSLGLAVAAVALYAGAAFAVEAGWSRPLLPTLRPSAGPKSADTSQVIGDPSQDPGVRARL